MPGYSIANDTYRRSSADVTHIPVTGLGMLGTNTDRPQRPQTIDARMHSSCSKVDGQTVLKCTLRGPTAPYGSSTWGASTRDMRDAFSMSTKDLSPGRGARSRSQSPTLQPSLTGGGEVYTWNDEDLPVHDRRYARGQSRLRPKPPAPPPTRKLSTLMNMDPDIPGMQTYNIPHTIGYDCNAIVRNAPQYTVRSLSLSLLFLSLFLSLSLSFSRVRALLYGSPHSFTLTGVLRTCHRLAALVPITFFHCQTRPHIYFLKETSYKI